MHHPGILRADRRGLRDQVSSCILFMIVINSKHHSPSFFSHLVVLFPDKNLIFFQYLLSMESARQIQASHKPFGCFIRAARRSPVGTGIRSLPPLLEFGGLLPRFHSLSDRIPQISLRAGGQCISLLVQLQFCSIWGSELDLSGLGKCLSTFLGTCGKNSSYGCISSFQYRSLLKR